MQKVIEPVWPACDRCGKPVSRLTGMLSIDTRAAASRKAGIKRYLEELQTDEKLVSYGGTDLMNLPQSIAWFWGHKRCSKGNDEIYWIEASRFDTLEKVLDWTFHVSYKNWFSMDSWEHVVRRIYTITER